ncbi:MAG TPA: hypothetical protein PLD20_15875 [Blastocatellia bacterium]|nr:hypothetical protein [Blastocatellia bacterium]HMV84705.1 hypothetical protein [Blastocatellia bacterium]HMX27324.1 hypothetical protein [Blastocatellia bacterium]HMY71209.1 hypothetical protein [Blastocatellia bacterium]HMZ19416.1 hypothetical protein [Blastocatellia bacterium]
MTKFYPPKKSQPRPPTLRLDTGRAWRQNDHAIIIPIIYDLPAPVTKPDEIIIPIASLRLAPQAPPKAELAPALFTIRVDPNAVYFQPSQSAFKRAHHLSIAVPLLLLAGIAVVVFAWMAFR